jgi:hypothetical protein
MLAVFVNSLGRTYKCQDIATIVRHFDGRILVSYCFAKVDIIVSARGILDWSIACRSHVGGIKEKDNNGQSSKGDVKLLKAILKDNACMHACKQRNAPAIVDGTEEQIQRHRRGKTRCLHSASLIYIYLTLCLQL